jgi:hypothetical protein
MKNILSLFLITVFIFIAGCDFINNDNTSENSKSKNILLSTPQQQISYSAEPTPDTQAPEVSKTTKNYAPNKMLEIKEVLVGGKQVLGLNYDEVMKIWGKPKEIKNLKVKFPATTEISIVYLLCYDGIEIEMYPESEDVPVENTSSFRFDITSGEYDIEGLKVGMDVNDYFKNYGTRQEFVLNSLSIERESNNEAVSLYKLITGLKEPDYYQNYEKAFYVPGVLLDENNEVSGAIGFAVLINGKKISRIVYGLPTAG